MNHHLHDMLRHLGRTLVYVTPSYVKTSKTPLPQIDQYGNVIKKELTPCERGDSRYQFTNGQCVPVPVPSTVIKGNATVYGPATKPACGKITVYVWHTAYATLAYVKGATWKEAQTNASCVASILGAVLSEEPKTGDFFDDKKWTGNGYHVVLPVVWYSALKTKGVKGLP